jgi:uncharacterized cupredoxin-like copper-binding protein
MIRAFAQFFISALLVLGLATAIACGDDDDSGSGSGSGSGSASGSASASGEPVGPGVVQAKPASATQVDVVLREWAVQPSVASVPAGQIYFLVDNQGPEDPHEFVVIKTDLTPDRLPVEQGAVPEDKVQLLDEIEPFSPGSKASLTLNLTAGTYALICNIAEVEQGQLESHYQLGMRASFRVQ